MPSVPQLAAVLIWLLIVASCLILVHLSKSDDE